MKLVSIVTVNFNQPGVTEDLLRSVFSKNNYSNLEIIVVDNGSMVNPVPGWQKKYPAVQFIRSEKNLGFAGGNNLGIAAAKGAYLFLINNDTEITENLISNLAATLDRKSNVGIISPKILYHGSNVIQYAGYTPLNYFTARNKCIGQFEKDNRQYDNIIGKTGYVHGAAMMVRREAIEKAGLMAENFFLYYEELDWCERIRKKGFEIWINTNASIYHKESMTVGKQSALKEYYMNRNRILLVRKHTHKVIYILFLMYFLFIAVPITLFRYIKAKQYHFIPVLRKAIWWNFVNRTDSRQLPFSLS